MFEISVLGPVEVRRDGRRCRCRAARPPSCSCAWRSRPGRACAPTGCSTTCGAAPRPAATRSSPRSPGCAARSATRRRSTAARAGTGSRPRPRRSTRCACCARPPPRARAGGRGRPRRRERSAAALARFRGDLLPAAGDWAAPQRARLEEARAQLLETGLAARLRLGDVAIGELEAAVAAHPYRERLWELLITALYRAGRQADALAAYRRVRARLADELGLEPGPGLRELERQVLGHDPALQPARAGNLPSLATELVGREEEQAALTALLGTPRLVEVVGPPGIGKTALAIATGRALGGTVWLARLEAAAPPTRCSTP